MFSLLSNAGVGEVRAKFSPLPVLYGPIAKNVFYIFWCLTKDSKEEEYFVSCRIHIKFKFQNP